MNKPKTPQKENLTEVDGRDTFQTPNYAVDLLIPFLTDISPTSPYKPFVAWECAAGLGKIVLRLRYDGFDVYGSDLDGKEFPKHNFLTQSNGQDFDCIVTNPPFSLKKKFFEMCLQYGKPFALLIPADYSGWLIEAVDKYGCEKVIPTRRIDYITPNILRRIQEGEIYEIVSRELETDMTLEQFKEHEPISWSRAFVMYGNMYAYDSIYDAPSVLLKKYSSSYYHSMWLTWGFNIGKSETFVELTNEEKWNI